MILRWLKTHYYSLAGLYFFVYLAGFVLVERLNPVPEHVISCFLDDWIPFCEWFVLPYFLWYLWIPLVMLLFLWKEEKRAYLEFCLLLFGGATLCLMFYAVWPNGLELRQDITAQNFCADLVRFLRKIDTPTNVCPSIHVSSTVAAHLVLCRSERVRELRGIRHLSLFVSFFICISTMFIKQHSAVDVFWGFVLSVVLGRLIWSAEERFFRKSICSEQGTDGWKPDAFYK